MATLVEVPGYGCRPWTAEELDEIAQRLLALHVPDGVLGPDGCAVCETPEACRPRRWARVWQRDRTVHRTRVPYLRQLGRLLGRRVR